MKQGIPGETCPGELGDISLLTLLDVPTWQEYLVKVGPRRGASATRADALVSIYPRNLA